MFVSKDKKRYLCMVCRKQIDKNKTPKKNQKNKINYSKFPTFLKNHLEKVVDYSKFFNKRNNNKNGISNTMEQRDMNQALRLNKLEAHLLKLAFLL